MIVDVDVDVVVDGDGDVNGWFSQSSERFVAVAVHVNVNVNDHVNVNDNEDASSHLDGVLAALARSRTLRARLLDYSSPRMPCFFASSERCLRSILASRAAPLMLPS